jgi:predicted P-loop ATPase
MYAQAVYLYEQGFNYWFDKDDIATLEGHNEEYRMQEREEEILPLLFEVPALGKGEFLTITEISDHLTTYGNIKRPMSTRALGVLMRKAGFEPNRQMINGRRVRGYVVHKRTRDEIDLLKKSLVPAEPVETEEDSGTDGQQPVLF